ncbi:MAG TPA: hypothetical protein VE866_17940 [Candidatus Binatia bacterium]|jgi:hypothetical protein|nr:hypothetical protein [Candidatus Binatia bacterium]
MIKKRAKGKTAAKKVGKKQSRSKRKNSKKELNPVGTWKDVAALVESHATKLTEAVIEEGEKKGQVSPVKFLFEMAKIQPPAEGAESTEEEESLAKTLFRTLNLPIVPIPTEQDEAEDTVVIPANVAVPNEGEKNGEPGKEGS